MDSKCLNNKVECINILKEWSCSVVENRLWNDYEDIHIDEIDSCFEDKNTWIEAGVFLLENLNKVIDNNKFDGVLFIPLSYSNVKSDIPLYHQLTAELDLTPPSLGIFPKENQLYLDTIKQSKYILELSNYIGMSVFFREEREQDVFFRILYIKK
ncbi:hypothetical protein [Dysgonomonas sp. BGC7]|uniref:hypothetical protein n=1 Tax=Dysgonomonas sp. BGC7 TaxID=1658008 RepID=UPI0006833466|nr:hypothetical protein [Dysgonomonas sp. BGC7]MBD8389039.1 hypothetical protein [Dysgonomonas sp. BGC7]